MGVRRHRALVAVLVAGAVLRFALLVGYYPAVLNYPDTWGYVRAAAGPLFHHDDVRPVGYALVLRALHAVSPTLTFVVAVQHVLGLATAVLAYATVRRMGWPRWVALAPAGVLALSPDFLYFEHSLLSETLFTFILLAALYATVRAIEGKPLDGLGHGRMGWLALAGLLLGCAVTVRSAALFVFVPVGLAVVFLRPARLLARVVSFAVVTASAGLVVATYGVARQASTGSFGFSYGGGWALYSRSASFADCRRFDPPEEGAVLCEATDPRSRFGGDYYGWHQGSPARRVFIGTPFHDQEVGAFGRAAIVGQPGDYLRVVVRDLWRYVEVDAHAPQHSGSGPAALDLEGRDPAAERLNRTVLEPYYGDYDIRIGSPTDAVAELQPIIRMHGPLVLGAVMLALLAVFIARGPDRAGIFLFAGTAIVVPVASVATAIYGWRYIVPVLPELAASGAMGASVLGQSAQRARERRRRGKVLRAVTVPPASATQGEREEKDTEQQSREHVASVSRRGEREE